MGGRGSGRVAGSHRRTCEDCHSVDLAFIRREGSLQPGYVGRITWFTGGHRTGWIEYRAERQGLRLVYRTRPYGGPWQDIDELVPYVEAATNFGGRRLWLQCLGCGNKCRILYGGDRFRCRSCWRLTYRSQYESAFRCDADRAHDLRARLGHRGALSDPFPAKPKGMHWTTYMRLVERDQKLRRSFWSGVEDWLTRMDPHREPER